MEMGVFESFNMALFAILNKLAEGYQAKLSADVTKLATASLSVWVLWKGYQILAGKIQTPMSDLIYDCVRFSLVLMFVGNVGNWLTSTLDALDSMKTFFSGGANVWASLDKLFESTNVTASLIFNADDSYVPLSGFTGSWYVWVGTLVLTLFTAWVYIVADITMFILSFTAPIFAFCLMFGFLRTMFNNWLQVMFASVLTVLFASFIMSLTIALHQQTLDKMADAEIESPLFMGVRVLLVGILGSILMGASRSFAQQIAGAGAEGAVAGVVMAGAKMGINMTRFLATKGASGGSGTGGGGGVGTGGGGGASVPNTNTQMQNVRSSQLDRKRNS